jgi:hypothetical protein
MRLTKQNLETCVQQIWEHPRVAMFRKSQVARRLHIRWKTPTKILQKPQTSKYEVEIRWHGATSGGRRLRIRRCKMATLEHPLLSQGFNACNALGMVLSAARGALQHWLIRGKAVPIRHLISRCTHRYPAQKFRARVVFFVFFYHCSDRRFYNTTAQNAISMAAQGQRRSAMSSGAHPWGSWCGPYGKSDWFSVINT